MADDGTEEKDQPPTKRRLDRLRTQEGATARSRDFAAAFTLLVVVAIAGMTAPSAIGRVTGAFSGFAELAARPESIDTGAYVDGLVGDLAAILLPVLLVGVVGFLFFSVIDTRGIVVSAKNMAIKPERLDPVKGIKRIFGWHGLSQFLKALIAVAAMSAVLAFVGVNFLNDILWSATCGADCAAPLALRIFAAILGFGLLAFIVVGLVDLPISRALFRHDNRMSISDIKREQKEEHGAREIRQERARLRRESARGEAARPKRAQTGTRQFSVRSQTNQVFLDFEPGSGRVPRVAFVKAVGAGEVPSETDVMAPALADDLAATIRPGQPIADRHRPALARIIVRLGLNR